MVPQLLCQVQDLRGSSFSQQRRRLVPVCQSSRLQSGRRRRRSRWQKPLETAGWCEGRWGDEREEEEEGRGSKRDRYRVKDRKCGIMCILIIYKSIIIRHMKTELKNSHVMDRFISLSDKNSANRRVNHAHSTLLRQTSHNIRNIIARQRRQHQAPPVWLPERVLLPFSQHKPTEIWA